MMPVGRPIILETTVMLLAVQSLHLECLTGTLFLGNDSYSPWLLKIKIEQKASTHKGFW